MGSIRFWTGLAPAGLGIAVLAALAAAGTPTSYPDGSGPRAHRAGAAIADRAPGDRGTRAATRTSGAEPIAGVDPLTVEPRVPRAAGAPCVVELARDLVIAPEPSSEPGVFALPPFACPGPWAKVLLVLDMDGDRLLHNTVAGFDLVFDDDGLDEPGDGTRSGSIHVGAPQINAALPSWHFERDITEYASVFDRATFLYLRHRPDRVRFLDDTVQHIRSVKAVFWPGSAATPAQRIADVVLGLDESSAPSGAALTATLPRNIERAYLDVYAQAVEDRFWWACVPDAVATAHPEVIHPFAIGDAHASFSMPPQGCRGGAYRELEVRIDGALAGLAPMFPWLPSDLNIAFANTVDVPAPSVQSVNMMPFRVDLTPFAGVLSDGALHRIEVSAPGGESRTVIGGQVLLYRDAGSPTVTGAVTRNTLATAPPSVSDDLARSGDLLQGTVRTYSRREYVIDGYVVTSHGRVDSRVWQADRFAHAQFFRIEGMPDVLDSPIAFTQQVHLSSTVDRVSRRMRGGSVLTEDREYRTYPLVVKYRMAGTLFDAGDGNYVDPDDFRVYVHQARGIRASHYRRGMARYATALSDVFKGSRFWLDDGSPYGRTYFHWSVRDYRFGDSFGSCYRAALRTDDGSLTSRTRGVGCPLGHNALRWYAHADGSPDGLGWAPDPH